LAIYWQDQQDQYREHVSVKRLREICIEIRNEMSFANIVNSSGAWLYQPRGSGFSYAIA